MARPDIIIAGSPRSGTYWMVDLLETRFGIAFPSETHFISIFEDYLWLYGDLNKRKNRKRLLRDIFQFVSIWTYNSQDSDEYRAGIRPSSFMAIYDEGLSDSVLDASTDYPSLISALFSEFAKLKGADAVGDKSAHYRVKPTLDTLDGLQDVKIVHVVRDGRDVAKSWIAQWFGPKTYAKAGHLWSEHVSGFAKWGASNPARYLELKYEDMATDLDACLAKLSKFLDRPVQDSQGPSATAAALSHTDSHAKIQSMKASDNIEKWRKLPNKDREDFEATAKPWLRDFGYHTDDPNIKSLETPHKFVDFSKHQFTVWVKHQLPLIIRLSAIIHFPVRKIFIRDKASIWQAPIKLD